jgi:hypothetical protein
MTQPGPSGSEDHIEAAEDDGSVELQPEDGGTAPPGGPAHKER